MSQRGPVLPAPVATDWTAPCGSPSCQAVLLGAGADCQAVLLGAGAGIRVTTARNANVLAS